MVRMLVGAAQRRRLAGGFRALLARARAIAPSTTRALLWATMVAVGSACDHPAIELLSAQGRASDAGLDDEGGLVDARIVPPRDVPAFDPRLVDSDGDGFTDAEELFLGSDPTGEGGSCAYGSYTAKRRTRAVDIMLVVDNSSSMDPYIQAIVARINQDFAAILTAAEVDYRVIVISRHGAIGHDSGNECDDHGICIEPPLAAGSCEPNAPPKQTDRFKHYSVCIDSNDALTKIRRAFDGTEVSRYFSGPGTPVTVAGSRAGFRQWLRDGAFRTFVLVTDDDSATRAAEFESWLYSREPRYFGTQSAPNFRFHSIVNVEENPDDPYTAWPATAPLVERGCWDGTNRWTGAAYQRLSMRSQGLRFPYCRSDNYDAVFRSVAASVTESATLPCTFSPPESDSGGTPDFSRVLVVYESGRFKRTLIRVGSPESCIDDGFYVVDGEIRLCPVVCEEVASDPVANIKTLVACFDDATCGDGDLDAGESCDDGNRVEGDGCDAACRAELR